jgi:hypothetical protein
VSRTDAPIAGKSLFAVTSRLQMGGEGSFLQVTLTLAGPLVPLALLAVTLYTCVPEVDAVAGHCPVVLVHPVHAKLVGLPVQCANSVIVVPT